MFGNIQRGIREIACDGIAFAGFLVAVSWVFGEADAGKQTFRNDWKEWFIPTLFNKEGLPASPFRTDAMPSIFGKASECADPDQPVCRYVVPTD